MTDWASHEKRIAELERDNQQHITDIDGLHESVHQLQEALESRQPAPEPVCERCGGAGELLSNNFDGEPIIPCPDCQPAPEPPRDGSYCHTCGVKIALTSEQRERGRELVRKWRNLQNHNVFHVANEMHDWIAEVCA